MTGTFRVEVEVPSSSQLFDTLAPLVMPRKMAMTVCPRWIPAGGDLVGVFTAEDGRIAAVACLDIPAAAVMAVSMVGLANNRVAECVNAGRVEEDLAEHAAEVLNVLGARVNDAGSPRLRLTQVVTAADAPDEVAVVLAGRRCDMTFEVGSLPAGRLILAFAEVSSGAAGSADSAGDGSADSSPAGGVL